MSTNNQTTSQLSQTRVRFSETNEEFSGTALDHAEATKGNIWYKQSDMKQIKEGAFMLARQAGKYGIGSLLGNTYGKDDPKSVDAVQAWAIACGERRGLERFHCRHYAKKRMEIRRKTIFSVLKAQRRMLVEEQLTDLDYVAVVIGRLSEAFSMDSRRFARVLGEADAVALQSSSPNDPPAADTPVEKKPKLIQRQKTPQSVMSLNPWQEAGLSPHVVSTSFSKTIPSPTSAATCLGYL